MPTGITIALIGAVPALVTACVSVYLNNRVLDAQIAALQKQFDKMEQKLDKHNQIVERVAILERDNKTAFNRIDELREDIHGINDKLMK